MLKVSMNMMRRTPPPNVNNVGPQSSLKVQSWRSASPNGAQSVSATRTASKEKSQSQSPSDKTGESGEASVDTSVTEKLLHGQGIRSAAEAVVGTASEAADGAIKQSKPRIVLWVSRVADHWATVWLTTFATVWILVCDDVRLYLFSKHEDPFFEAIVIFCILLFTMDTLFSALAKPEYMCSFFFFLDITSTATLVLDIPRLQEALYATYDGEDAPTGDRTRAAKMGAKAARVVRVIRLIRLVRLYKLILVGMKGRLVGLVYSPQSKQDDPEFDVDEDSEDDDAMRQESRVGKKLSDLTMKRVIFLVLAMLVCVPPLEANEGLKLPRSPDYGADEVYHFFNSYLNKGVDRTVYEHTFLRFAFYHNWFSRHFDMCPGDGAQCPRLFYGQLFWLGVRGNDAAFVKQRAMQAQIEEQTVLDFNYMAQRQDNLFNYGHMPNYALRAFYSNWTDTCCKDIKEDKGDVTYGASLIANRAVGSVLCPKDLRRQEVKTVVPRVMSAANFRKFRFIFYFDLRPFIREDALYSMGVTGFVCVALCFAAMSFASDTSRLVLRPLEHMMEKVERIRSNPLEAIRLGDEEFRSEEARRLKAKQGHPGFDFEHGVKQWFRKDKGGAPPLETVILEKTIIKLGSLLALGFGPAGANIINQNLVGGDTAGVDVMIAGQKVDCIIGQASIDNFSAVTEVLQARVMAFVNQVSEILHGIVDEFHGGANKNNGDVFLFIWRHHPDEDTDNTQWQKLAGMSIVAFSKAIGALERVPMLIEYRSHPGLQMRFGSVGSASRFKVRVSFGMHAGWAIEGAVGSEFKIDASYLSPNVSIATNIQRAADTYDVQLLVSQALVDICTTEMASECRLIDRVLIPGSIVPLELYTVDLDTHCLNVEPAFNMARRWNPRQRFKVRQFLEVEKTKKWEQNAVKLFSQEPLISMMRKKYTQEFLQVFQMGYDNYIEGEWAVARGMFERTKEMLSTPDGPSMALLAFMQETNDVAPSQWKGFRELDLTAVARRQAVAHHEAALHAAATAGAPTKPHRASMEQRGDRKQVARLASLRSSTLSIRACTPRSSLKLAGRVSSPSMGSG